MFIQCFSQGREQWSAALYITHLGVAKFSVITQQEPKNSPTIQTQIAEDLLDSRLYVIKATREEEKYKEEMQKKGKGCL